MARLDWPTSAILLRFPCLPARAASAAPVRVLWTPGRLAVARYSTLDKLLLLVWLPFVVLLLALHVREVVRTGLAQPAVFATPPDVDGYPRVGGRPLELDPGRSGLVEAIRRDRTRE
jgi:hypothetical protein